MKKILTLALALVLVFAIAAPALAITGELPSDEKDTKVAPVELAVELFTAAPVESGFGGFQVSKIAANKAYIVNEIAFYGVAVHFIDPDTDEDFYMAANDYEGAVLTLESDAIALNEGVVEADIFDAKENKWTPGVPTAWQMNDCKWNVPNAAWETGRTVYFFAQGVVEAKGVLKAELAVEKELAVGTNLLINDADGELQYTVAMTGVEDAYTYTVTIAGTTTHTVSFVTDEDEVTSILVDGNVVVFSVPVSGGGSVVKSIGGVTSSDSRFAALNAAYEEVMAFFGFNYDAEGLLLPKHFERKAASLNLKDEAVINLYTADIVVPGGVNPPKTGDAATVVGFVMIVVAMIAAGVVVSRKVRA